MNEKDRSLVQVVTLDKDDILVFDVGKLSVPQSEMWLKNHQKLINYQHRNPCLMALRDTQGLTIIKRPYAASLQEYSDEVWEENMKKVITDREEKRKIAIDFRKALEDSTKKELEAEIERLQTHLDTYLT